MAASHRCVHCLALMTPDTNGRGLYHDDEVAVTRRLSGGWRSPDSRTLSGSSSYGSLYPLHSGIEGENCPGFDDSPHRIGIAYVSV